MDNIGGAEIVTLTLARELKADLYTTNIDVEKIKKMGFEDVLNRVFSIGKVSKKSPFRQQAAFTKFRKLNLSGSYDFFIISGDWAMSGAFNNHPNIWYAHSPLNELWALRGRVKREILKVWQKPIYDIWVLINRCLSLKYSKRVDIFVCNSKNTKNRIKKYYQRNAIIINPPVYTSNYYNNLSKDYWLSVNRLTKNKRIELQLKAFSLLPSQKLVIVGSYEQGSDQFETYKKYLCELKPSNVEIIHWEDTKKIIELYANCKGFITSSRDEDFGMTPIEAMASGKPVIAPNESGYKETLINKVTGVLIDDIDEGKLAQAILEVDKNLNKNPNMYKEVCIKQAKHFNSSNFIKKINLLINNKKQSI
ncbi:MAG: glycosyltransferase [Patescibacteria group bacterium]